MEEKSFKKESPDVIEGLSRFTCCLDAVILYYLVVEIVGFCGLICRPWQHFWPSISDVRTLLDTAE